MKSANLANKAERNCDVGHVWEEKITNGQGTLKIEKYSTIRVRAAGATTVTIDGVLAATMLSGEVMLFNVGAGVYTTAKDLVQVVIGGANAYVQVAKNK